MVYGEGLGRGQGDGVSHFIDEFSINKIHRPM